MIMEILKRSKIIVCCKGCKSILRVYKGELKVCGVADNNTCIDCPVCNMRNLITINGIIQSNVNINNDYELK